MSALSVLAIVCWAWLGWMAIRSIRRRRQDKELVLILDDLAQRQGVLGSGAWENAAPGSIFHIDRGTTFAEYKAFVEREKP